MQLDGMILTKCPPEDVAALLLSPDALHHLLPEGCEVGARAGDSIPFTIRRRVGPINLSMAGNLTLKPSAAGKGFDLVIAGSHIVAGRVKVALHLIPNYAALNVRSLEWKGTVEAHGLSSRLIEGRVARIRGLIKGMFSNLRDHAERG